MKIAIIFDNFGPYHLARLSAASRVCDLFAIEMNRCSRDYAWRLGAGPRPFQSVTLNTSSSRGPLKSFVQSRQVWRELTRFSPECVFIPGWAQFASFQCLAWCAANRIPAVMMSETTEMDSRRSYWKEQLKARVVRKCSAGFVGGTLHAKYMEKLGMPNSRTIQGYDVVDNAHFRHGAAAVREREEEFRQLYNLPPRYFLASARFLERKNLGRLIFAFAEYRRAAERHLQLAPKGPPSGPWSLVLLGDGAQRTVLQELIRELRLERFVHLPGFVQYDDLAVYYALAGAFVHPSICEPWGLVVNEAMASGLAVLVSNRCGCAADLVVEGGNGFTFDPENRRQLTSLLLGCSRNRERTAAMGLRSAEIILNWGLPRFANGLHRAAEMAVPVRVQQPGREPALASRALAESETAVR